MLPAQAVGFAVAQYGLTSTAQMLSLGMSREAIRWYAKIGDLLPERRGVWRLAGTPDLPEQPVMAAILAAGPDAAAAGWTAGALLGMPKAGLAVPVCLTATRQLRMAGVEYHRPATVVLDRDLTVRRNIPTTGAARALCDNVRFMDASLVQPWVDHAIRKRLETPATLDETCSRFERVGARKIEIVRAAIERIVPGQEKTDDDWEVEALRVIAAAGLPQPVVQLKITIRGRQFTIDLAWPSRRLGVELKGFNPHGGRAAFDYDNNIKENAFRSIGWTVYAYTTVAPWDLMLNDITPHLLRTMPSPATP